MLGHSLKLLLLTGGSRLPGRIGAICETRRLRRLKAARGARVLERFERCVETLGPGDVAVDLGANIGVYTERMAHQGASVFAFEPEPWTFRRLSARTAALANVTCIEAAAGLVDGTVSMRRNPDFERDPELQSLGTSVVDWTPSLPVGSTFEARCVDFLRFLRELPGEVSVLKMDIEGGEVPLLEALLAAPEARRIRTAFVETHEVNMPELRARLGRLRAALGGRADLQFDLDWP